MRWSNGASAFGDGFGKLFVWVWMLDAPLSQKGNQVRATFLMRPNSYDSDKRPPGLDQQRSFTAGVDAIRQVRKVVGCIINRYHSFIHINSLAFNGPKRQVELSAPHSRTTLSVLRRRARVLSQVDIIMTLTILTTDRDFEALPETRTEDWSNLKG